MGLGGFEQEKIDSESKINENIIENNKENNNITDNNNQNNEEVNNYNDINNNTDNNNSFDKNENNEDIFFKSKIKNNHLKNDIYKRLMKNKTSNSLHDSKHLSQKNVISSKNKLSLKYEDSLYSFYNSKDILSELERPKNKLKKINKLKK